MTTKIAQTALGLIEMPDYYDPSTITEEALAHDPALRLIPETSPEHPSHPAYGVGTRHDHRYVTSDHPEAVLRAWGGADAAHATMDMGGWTDGDIDAFESAVQDEAVRMAGEPLGHVEIERIPMEIPASAEILEELADRRVEANLRQADVGAELGWPTSTVSERERGKRRTTLEQLDAWQAALDALTRKEP